MQEALRRATQRWRELLVREMVTAPLPPPEEGRVENPLFRFVFVPPLAQQPAVPKTSIKEQFPQSLGLKRRRVVYRASRDHVPPPLSPGRGGLPKSTHVLHPPFVEPGKGRSTQAPATSRHTQAGLLCFPPHEEESGECYTTHPDPAPCHHRPGRHRPRAGSLCSTSLPHHGYVGDPVGAAGTVSRSLASAPQSISVAPTDHQTRLCDSVHPASPQVQGHPVHFSQGRRCSCLAGGNRSPTGEGRDRAGPSSRYGVGVVLGPYFIVPKKGGGLRPILDLRVLNRALHKLPFKMLTQKRIFGCVRPLDWFAAIDLKDAYFHVSILP